MLVKVEGFGGVENVHLHHLYYNKIIMIGFDNVWTIRKLSTEEVNALMEGLRSGDLSTSTSLKDSSAIEYKTFNFGSDDLTLLEIIMLTTINERFARTVRSVFYPYLEFNQE